MPNYKVDINKGVNGWLAVTCIELGERRVLMLKTGRHTVRGIAVGVEAMATVYQAEPSGVLGHTQALFGHPLDGDFCQQVVTSSGKCTEHNVRTLHAAALDKVDDLLAGITKFYRAKAERAGIA